MAHTVFHTCSLCEATCGLTFKVEDNRIVSVRPDDDDVFSKGYVCPKGIAIADIDRTDYFLCLGGNPMISNGSVMTAPDMRRRLRAVRERGGKVVVVDPRRTETAKEADEHVAIRPGGDAAFLLAMVRVLVEHGRIDRAFVERTTSGWPEIER